MTRRSRSSFDLRDALDTAEALSPRAPAVEERIVELDGAPIVTFQLDRSSQPPRAPSTPAPAPPPIAPAAASPTPPAAAVSALGPPPELASLRSLGARVDAAIAWLRRDPEVERLLVVDGEGLPMAGDLAGAEELAAAAGGVVSAMRRLGAAAPSGLAPEFATSLGARPTLQLVGLLTEAGAFVIGVARSSAYAEADLRRIRAAFAASLAEP